MINNMTSQTKLGKKKIAYGITVKTMDSTTDYARVAILSTYTLALTLYPNL